MDAAKRKLDDQDARLAEFQKKYMGALPEQEQTNLGLLAGMNTQLDAITQAMTRAQQDKSFNESILSSQLANWKTAKSGEVPAETMEQQLTGLQDQLAALQARYTPDHPDVRKVENQIAQLQKKMSEVPKATSPAANAQAGIEPPSIQQLRAKLRQDDLNIADLAKRQTQIQGQVGVLQGRIQSTPAVEQQFKELTRSHQNAVDFYNDLLRKHDQAAVSRDLTRQQQGEQFRVFAGGGFGGGLALGLAILYLIAALDSSMYTERDVEVCLKLPVLAMLPTLEPAGRQLANVKGKGSGLGFASTRT